MGGILIIFASVLSTLLWANLTNHLIWLVVMVTVGFGIIGFMDDYQKLTAGDSKGISARKGSAWSF